MLDFWSPRVEGLRRRRDVAGIVDALRGGGLRTRRAAANALIAIPDSRATDALARAATDPDALLRANAVLALGELRGPQSPEEERRVQDVLVGALGDPEPRVRAMAASALGRVRSPASLDALVAALADGDRVVGATARAVLRAYDDPRAAEALAR